MNSVTSLSFVPAPENNDQEGMNCGLEAFSQYSVDVVVQHQKHILLQPIDQNCLFLSY